MNTNSENLHHFWNCVESNSAFNLSVMQNGCYSNPNHFLQSPAYGNSQRNFFDTIDIPFSSFAPINISNTATSSANNIYIQTPTSTITTIDGNKKFEHSSKNESYISGRSISKEAGESHINLSDTGELLNKNINETENCLLKTSDSQTIINKSVPIFTTSKISIPTENHNTKIQSTSSNTLTNNKLELKNSDKMFHSIETPISNFNIIHNSHFIDYSGNSSTSHYHIAQQQPIHNFSGHHKLAFNNFLTSNNMTNLYTNIPLINEQQTFSSTSQNDIYTPFASTQTNYETNSSFHVGSLPSSIPKHLPPYTTPSTTNKTDQKTFAQSSSLSIITTEELYKIKQSPHNFQNNSPSDSSTIETISPKSICSVCLNAPSNGLHFGAKACAACAAFFRRSISDNKKYICKKSQRCIITTNVETGGYRKMCRECRMKRCLSVGMQPANVQNRRQIHMVMPRKDYLDTGLFAFCYIYLIFDYFR
uniref:Nuclear receptor domain-containing protein n=1 Tax=Strongyloides papillosus TaxID=174720 RepID=A0A0N5BXJ3_STREA